MMAKVWKPDNKIPTTNKEKMLNFAKELNNESNRGYMNDDDIILFVDDYMNHYEPNNLRRLIKRIGDFYNYNDMISELKYSGTFKREGVTKYDIWRWRGKEDELKGLIKERKTEIRELLKKGKMVNLKS